MLAYDNRSNGRPSYDRNRPNKQWRNNRNKQFRQQRTPNHNNNSNHTTRADAQRTHDNHAENPETNFLWKDAHDNDAASDDCDTAVCEQSLTVMHDDRQAYRFVLDSGATRHTWCDSSVVKDQRRVGKIRMTGLNNRITTSDRVGTVTLGTGLDGKAINARDVVVMPSCLENLISVPLICNQGLEVLFTRDHADIRRRDGSIILTVKRSDTGLYQGEIGSAPSPKQRRGLDIVATDQSQKPTNKSVKHIPRKKMGANANVNAHKPSASQQARNELTKQRAKQKDTATYAVQRNGSFDDRAERGYLFVERRPVMDGYHASLLASDKSDKTADDARLKHVRFGHQSVYGLKNCPTCMVTRTRRPAIRSKPYVSAEAPLQTVCADVAGPVSVSVDGQRQRCPSVTGALYALLMQDEYSRYVWSDTLPNKSDVTATTIDTLKLIQNELSLTVRRFHSDGGSEFVNRTMGEYLRSNGIRQTCTTTDKPSHNGKVERVNQTIMAITRSIMEDCQLSVRYWNYAVQYATMIYNYTPLKAIGGVSPYKKLYGKEPNVNKLKVFGCNVVYVLPDKERSKIQATSAAW